MSEDLAGHVAAWLAEQGYPLEMRTAQTLRRLGLSVQPGWYYADIETGQQRETDIYASAHAPLDAESRVRVSVAIECKSSTKVKPWVLFGDQHTRINPKAFVAQRFAVPRRWCRDLTEDVSVQGAPLLSGYDPVGYALTRAFAGGNEDVAFGAMAAAAKATAGICRWLSHDSGSQLLSLVLPVVLIDAPLFACSLDENGDMQLQQVDRGTVLWKYQLTPKHPPTTIVTVLTEAALPALGTDMITLAQRLATAVMARRREMGTDVTGDPESDTRQA